MQLSIFQKRITGEQVLTPTKRTAGRVLSPTELVLTRYLGSEREAIAFAPHVFLPHNPTQEQIRDAVAEVLCKALVAAAGVHPVQIEYLGGQRRDTLRAS